MKKTSLRGLILAVGAGMLFVAAAQAPEAQSGATAALPVTILGARVDRVAGTMTIQGKNLRAWNAMPEVSLGGAPLVVSSAALENIVAALPPGLAPGSLLLTVTLDQGGNTYSQDSFAASIPAHEIVTPDGIRIESTGSDVLILAGTSRITVDPAGGITIESDGPLNVRTPGALDLRGRTVNVASETTLTLSGTTVNVDATSLADIGGARVNLHATSLADITGTTINVHAGTLADIRGTTVNVRATSVADIRGTSRVSVTGGLVTLN